MQRTSNYGLCQYEGSDKTSYLVNYNDDMLKIDTAIKAASDDAASAQTKADTADGKADTNAQNISSLNTQINGEGGVAADVSTLQGAMNTVTSLIGNGEPTTTDKTLIGAINELNSNDGALSSLTTTEKSSLVGAINEVNAGKADASDLANIHLGEVLKYTADTSATDRAHQIASIYSAYSNLSNSEKIHSYIKRGSYAYRCTSHGNTGMYVTEIEDNGDIRTEMIVLTNDASTSKLLRYVVSTSNTVTFTDGSTESASSDLELYISHVTT